MKKKQKSSKRKKKIKKNRSIKRVLKPKKIPQKRIKKNLRIKKREIRKKKITKIRKIVRVNRIKKDSVVLKLIKFQLSLKPEFNFKLNFSLEKYIQGFFDKISETISNYKTLKYDEKRR